MSRSYADLPLHYGQVPPWLYQRMSRLGVAIVEAIILQFGREAFLSRVSDPFWFQSLGAVMGMDWHSSGITTSVMGALKQAVNKKSDELGIYICGGKGRHSRETPAELQRIGERAGFDAASLIRSSRLSAKVDNTAIQDGFQLYLHSFILSSSGSWAVVQQGMNDATGMARRYHWHSANVHSFLEAPHTSIVGESQGVILNLTDKEAAGAKSGMLELVAEQPHHVMDEIRRLVLPGHHDVRAEDINLKRLGSVLAVAHEKEVRDMENLLLLEGVGPRTIQSLALVSEVIYGMPSRFEDPARFSFAHGGKDGHPFPVPVKVYDETISTLDTALRLAKIGQQEKNEAIRNLHTLAQRVEKDFIPNDKFEELVAKEREESWKYGGKTVFGDAKPPRKKKGVQLRLF